MSELRGGPGSPCVVEMLTSPEVTGNVLPVVPAGGSPLAGAVNPAGPDGPVVAGGPVGPCETLSPSSCGVLEPLEHSVLIHAVSMLLLGRCPYLTVALLAQLASMLQGALSAQMFCLKFWNRAFGSGPC